MTIADTVTKLMLFAKLNPDKEVCGLLDTEGDIYPVDNEAKEPQNCFVFNKRQYIQTLRDIKEREREVLCVYHTHPSGDATPSKADVEFAHRCQFPSLVVTHQEYRWVH